ncbi:DUF4230 domain-containing protein [Bergeyella sp. RCAD1439]|uniref:DUF4230 domain-containing protein n=1 Tax=Bergeyella anatis TaxID=3113737 RepID=UPI002E16D93A|nr:DUF4230 domain-containing protein [Bergeyella sp. RCAD1439]
MKTLRYLFVFAAGIAFTLLAVMAVQKLTQGKEAKTQNDYYVITNQIQKMNKMVVMEQDFSVLHKTKITSEFLGSRFLPSMDKQIVTFTKTNAQVSYDLTKMKIQVDSLNKKLVITELPTPEIKITPSVEIQSMDDSFFNRIDENDLRKIQNKAKDYAIQQVDKNRLQNEGKKQLLENLNQIFVLAKALNYTIEDQTGQLDPSRL